MPTARKGGNCFVEALARPGPVRCRVCHDAVQAVWDVLRARASGEMGPPRPYDRIFARWAASQVTLRGRGGRRREIEQELARMGYRKRRRGQVPFDDSHWQVAVLATAFFVALVHWRQCPQTEEHTRPLAGVPSRTLNPASKPGLVLRQLWRDAHSLLGQKSPERFLAAAEVLAEKATVRILRTSVRTVRRRLALEGWKDLPTVRKLSDHITAT